MVKELKVKKTQNQKSKLAKKEDDPSVCQCAKCGLGELWGSCEGNFVGKGSEKVLFVVPSSTFLMDYAKALAQVTEAFECNVLEECWILSAICCSTDKTPTKAQYGCCLPYLRNKINEVGAKVIVPVGNHAIESMISMVWSDKFNGADRWMDWTIPVEGRFWLCPSLNPINVLKSKNPVQSRILFNQLNAAFSLVNTDVPLLVKPKILYPETLEELSNCLNKLKPKWAFDYETNGLKPFPNGSRIHSMAISDGCVTFSFPMLQEFQPIIKQYLTNQDEKIAANSQFERIWSSKILDCAIENLIHDTMLHSHVQYARKGTNSLKFQSFVQLGVDYYAGDVDKYLDSEDGDLFNRIHLAPQAKVLEYNGLDAYYTFKLYEKQIGVL